MNDTAQDFEQVMKDLRELKADVARLLSDARAETRTRADHMYEQVKLKAEEPIETVSHYVREQPLTGLLIAFGVGYVLGGLTRGHR